MRIIFFCDDTRIRTSEDHQDYKRTVNIVLDHNVTAAVVVSTSTILLQIYINFFMIIFFSDDPWIQPTKTRLVSGHSIY